MNGNGLIHVYCGDGKGKTTAALGLVMRASGAGMKTLVVQFLKGRETGELKSLALLPGVQVIRGNPSGKFSFEMDERERRQAYEMNTKNLLAAVETARAEACGLLVLDEILGALSAGLVDEELLRDFVIRKPAPLELVLTGRNPPGWMLDAADYVSEICKRKHPYDRGIPARRGIEW